MATIGELEASRKSINQQIREERARERKAERMRARAGKALAAWQQKYGEQLTLQETSAVIALRQGLEAGAGE